MNSNESRTKRTALNACASLADNLIKLIIKFASRYVFIFTLGQQYLGVSALFTSIITMLSLADLGFGIALPQALYKPLAEKDEDRICMILRFYAKVYKIIATVVILVGMAFLPFLKYIISAKETSGISHLNIIYILFILQSAASYLFIYKKTLFTADQKNYYVTVIESATSIISTLVQIIILLVTRNYLLYLLVSIIAIVIQNIFISRKCDKYYPFLKNINKARKLDASEAKVLSKKIYALFIYKAAIAVETGTDNLVMTTLCGLVLTGLCSNYTLIISSITSILMMVMSAATASIGNVVVTESKENTYKIYALLDFIGFWVYSVCGVCMATLINPFINMWLGESYTIGLSTVIILCINFYISGTQNVNSNFRNAYGLFYEGRYRPICMIIINLGSSIVLAKYLGVTGIFIGTLLSRLLTVGTFDPYIVFKYGLHMSLKKYYKSHILYHMITLCTGTILFVLFAKWTTTTVLAWIIKALCLFISVNIVYMILFQKNKSFIDLCDRIKKVTKRIFYGECN